MYQREFDQRLRQALPKAVLLYGRIRVKISEVNIAQAVIMTELVEKLSKEEMEL